MKIFYKKDYEYLKVKYEKSLVEFGNKKRELINKIEKEEKHIQELIEQLGESDRKNKSLECAKGGTTKYINKLLNQIKEQSAIIESLQKQLAESMTDKYIVKKIKPGKTPNLQKQKIKDNAKNSRIIKKVKES